MKRTIGNNIHLINTRWYYKIAKKKGATHFSAQLDNLYYLEIEPIKDYRSSMACFDIFGYDIIAITFFYPKKTI